MHQTIVLRALAALLIANSHIEPFYPIRQLAADGLLGDSLFFFLSGFGLVLSQRRAPRPFAAWYSRRIARIHPSIILVVLLFDYVPGAGWSSWTASDYILNLGWGRSYAFIGQILTFYIVFYGIMECRSRSLYLGLIGLLFLPYGLIPTLGRTDALFHAFHWIYYFQVMLFGGWLASRTELAPVVPGAGREGIALAAVMAIYVGTRVAVATGRFADWFFLPHLLVFPIVYLLLRLVHAPRVARILGRRPWLAGTIAIIGGSPLEMYLMHYQVLNIPWVASLAFPLNVVIFLCLSVILAWTLARVAGWLRDRLPGTEPARAEPRVNMPRVPGSHRRDPGHRLWHQSFKDLLTRIPE